MQTTIELQECFRYSYIPIILSIISVIAITFYLKYLKTREKEKPQENKVKLEPPKNIKNTPEIKNKYLNKIKEIEDRYNNNAIELRKAYQLISETIRMFVYEMTGITTQNYSLEEIKKLNMQNVYELIKEYYEPEFASKSEGDFNSAIEKARRVVKEWN